MYHHKKLDPSQLLSRITQIRKNRQRIVLTNGCFDILHRGHVTYLEQAKTFGDILIVGVNSDESIRRLKGPDRPINTMDDRMEVLAALNSVDLVVPFSESTAVKLVKMVKPDVYVKGGDYTLDTLPEAHWTLLYGGLVEILPYLSNQSTTEIIKKIRRQSQKERIYHAKRIDMEK